ncbi:hypothetical protein JZU71_04130, partial [bacterium]|nr:hypothetical protein [bacterium]
ATFVLENELRAFLHVGEVEDISGWMDSHVCVTAAAAAIPVLNERLNPWLLDHQLPDGSWDAYWWEGHEYSSSLAVEALKLGNSEQMCR